MRCLVCPWWVSQPSRLCSTTVSTSSMWLSQPPAVTKAGTRSTCNLVLTPPVHLRRAIHWVGFIFLASLKLFLHSSSVFPVQVYVIKSMCLARFWELSVVLEKRPAGTHHQLQQAFQLPLHIQHCGQQCSCTLRHANTNKCWKYIFIHYHILMLSISDKRFRITHPEGTLPSEHHRRYPCQQTDGSRYCGEKQSVCVCTRAFRVIATLYHTI